MSAPAAAPARELQKFALKVFAEADAGFEAASLIPVFHRWIQASAGEEGTLIDVADYSHLPQSPGVLLVGFEADLAIDRAEGPLGLLWTRKAPQEGAFRARVAAGLRTALAAAARLEADLDGALRFRKTGALFLANDRLLAPNDDATWAALRADLEGASADVFGAPAAAREAGDPRRRLAVRLGSE